jgi:L-ribulose-5-phosphate 3-epimerase
MHRRQFVHVSLAALGTLRMTAGSERPAGIRLGMCDWNVGQRADSANILRAREAGLDGLQVSLGRDPGDLPLRQPEVRRQFLALSREHGVTLHSVALGMLNSIPMKSEPQAAVLAVEALEAAAALGAANVLLAFFGKGELRQSDAGGQFQNRSGGPFRSYALDDEGVRKVVDTLRLLAPRAAQLKVVLGLENTLTAEQNLGILEQVGSPWVQVYYDVGNSTEYGYDVAGEIRRLGRDRICEIHLKDSKTPLLGSAEGVVDFAAAAAACRDIGYNKWYVLETSGRKNRFLEDTRANLQFARRTFGGIDS